MAPFRRILDVFTSQWFSLTNEPAARSGKAAHVPAAVQFLRTDEVRAFVEAATIEAAERVIAELPEQDRPIAQATLDTLRKAKKGKD